MGLSENDLGAVITVLVAILSLLGNLMQYSRSPKRAKTEEGADLAQSINNITEAYDNLFENLKEHIRSLQVEVDESNVLIKELKQVKEELEAKLDKQQKQIDKQQRELITLRKRVKDMENGTKRK